MCAWQLIIGFCEGTALGAWVRFDTSAPLVFRLPFFVTHQWTLIATSRVGH